MQYIVINNGKRDKNGKGTQVDSYRFSPEDTDPIRKIKAQERFDSFYGLENSKRIKLGKEPLYILQAVESSAKTAGSPLFIAMILDSNLSTIIHVEKGKTTLEGAVKSCDKLRADDEFVLGIKRDEYVRTTQLGAWGETFLSEAEVKELYSQAVEIYRNSKNS